MLKCMGYMTALYHNFILESNQISKRKNSEFAACGVAAYLLYKEEPSGHKNWKAELELE